VVFVLTILVFVVSTAIMSDDSSDEVVYIGINKQTSCIIILHFLFESLHCKTCFSQEHIYNNLSDIFCSIWNFTLIIAVNVNVVFVFIFKDHLETNNSCLCCCTTKYIYIYIYIYIHTHIYYLCILPCVTRQY
jgi:hypothetical protein